MNRKDLELLAKMIKSLPKDFNGDLVALLFVEHLEAHVANFDRKIFLKRCSRE